MNSDTDVKQLIQVLSQLPPAPEMDREKSLALLTTGKMTCRCGKLQPVQNLEHISTGVISIVSNVCKDCPSALKEDREMARIVCCSCKQIVARMAPHKTPVGFVFERNRSYHVDKCGVCHPGLVESLILEELLFNRSQGRGRLRA